MNYSLFWKIWIVLFSIVIFHNLVSNDLNIVCFRWSNDLNIVCFRLLFWKQNKIWLCKFFKSSSLSTDSKVNVYFKPWFSRLTLIMCKDTLDNYSVLLAIFRLLPILINMLKSDSTREISTQKRHFYHFSSDHLDTLYIRN